MSREGKALVLTADEFKRTIQFASTTRHGKRNVAILYTQFSLALRACELRKLRLGDVMAPDGSLLEAINLLSHMTKGKKQRHAYLTNKPARKALTAYIEERQAEASAKKKSLKPNETLFISQKGSEFLPSDMVRLICGFYKNVGIVGAKSHTARRTRITNLIDSGVDMKAIADMVGHSCITTTAGYHDSNPKRLMKIAEKPIF